MEVQNKETLLLNNRVKMNLQPEADNNTKLNYT